MLFQRQTGALSPFLACLAAIAVNGCISTQTKRALDASFEATEPAAHGLAPERRAQEVDLSGPLDRELVISQAVARSSALMLMAHRARALVHAGRAEGSLPAAEVEFQAWNLPLTRPYALGQADMYMLELQQRFPPGGSLDGRARAMAEEARAVLAELSLEEQLVAERAASAFAEYAQALAEQRALERQTALLDRMRGAVGARYTTGGASLSDVARIDVEVAKTQRARARVAGDIARSRATLNALLRRPAAAPLGEPRDIAPETVRTPLAELLRLAQLHRGSTVAADARVRAADARRDAVEAEASVPEFMLGLGYWQAPNLRPGLGLSASMSLPWLWGPGSERLQQAQEEQSAELAERESIGVDAQAEVSEAHARMQSLQVQLEVIRLRALPATQRSMEALTAAFATGNSSLLEWVDVARSALDLELESITLRGDLARAVASLERAVGTRLPREALAQEVNP